LRLRLDQHHRIHDPHRASGAMNVVALVALGGAIGSVARYLLAMAVDQQWPGSFPLGTFLVNVSGCFLIGLISDLTDNLLWRQLLMTGVMGGYTTFSSFSLQSIRLARSGAPLIGSGYVLASLAACLIATLLGQACARMILMLRAR
jgi:CrcB protein